MSGEHQDGKSNDDVHHFSSSGKALNKFPRNLEKIFKNLDSIEINAAKISTLENKDLMAFKGQLKWLNFTDNNIEVIEANLFEFNPNLEKINLDGNQIKFVGNGAFDNLHNLSSLEFKNPCYSGSASNHSEVVKLITEIKNNCIDLEAYERFKNSIASSSECLKSGKLKAILSFFVVIFLFM